MNVNFITEKPFLTLHHFLVTHKELRLPGRISFKKITSGGPPLGPDSALVCPTLQQASGEIAPKWLWLQDATSEAARKACNNLEGRVEKPSLSLSNGQ